MTLILSLSCLVRCLLFGYSEFTSKGGVSLLDSEDDDDDDYNFYLCSRVCLLILQREEWREKEREISV